MKKSSKKTLLLLLFVVLFFFFYHRFFHISQRLPIYYWDEFSWISQSYFFDLAIKGDFNNQLWKSDSALEQPHLAKSLYGLVLYPKYLVERSSKNENYTEYLIRNNFYEVFQFSNEFNSKNINYIPWGRNPASVTGITPNQLISRFSNKMQDTINIILSVRKINALILSLNCIVVLAIFRKVLHSTIIAILGSLLYAYNNLLINTALVAYGDCLFLLLFNICIYLLIVILENGFRWRDLFLFAFISSLLNNTKINGVMVIFIFYIILLIKFTYEVISKQKINIKTIILKSQFIFISFLFFLVIFNPYLWDNPLTNIVNYYLYRYKTVGSQMMLFPQDALFSIKDRIVSIYNVFFVNWRYIYQNSAINVILQIAFIIGIFFSITQVHKNRKIRYFFSISVLSLILITAYLSLNWSRYYAPLILFVVFFEICGIYCLIKKIRPKIFNLRI